MPTETSTLHLTVENKTAVLVKPSKPTPLEVLSLSTLDNDPSNEYMAKTIQIYGPNDENGGNKEPVSLLQEALARVLVYYYPFAGKVRKRSCDGRLELICNGDGVPFAAATASCSLSDLNYLVEFDQEAIAKLLIPDYDITHDPDELYHPLALKITKFSCGGFTVGWSCAHMVSDGAGAAQFFRALAEMASGMTEPMIKPVWERERLVARDVDVKNCDHNQPFNTHQLPHLALSPYMPTTDTVTRIISVTSRRIKTLKAMMKKESGDTSSTFTTVEVLSAYIWRSRARALEFKPDEMVVLYLVVGVRNVLDPPLPKGYYGNAILDVVITLTRKELDELPFYQVVKLIKNAKKTFSSNRYVQDEIGDREKGLSRNVKLFEEDKGGALMAVTDWRNLGFFDDRIADFGWNTALDVMPINRPPDDVKLCTFLPPSKMDSAASADCGGARVVVTLPRAALPRFMEEIEALHKL